MLKVRPNMRALFLWFRGIRLYALMSMFYVGLPLNRHKHLFISTALH